MKLTLTPPPEGYEAEAEWRLPKKGETVLNDFGRIVKVSMDYHTNRYIVLTMTDHHPQEPLRHAYSREEISRQAVQFINHFYGESGADWRHERLGLLIEFIHLHFPIEEDCK